ncbi:branched-chain amino acid transporter AzlC [Maritimibacter sp. 55A14]|uniref:AzlC family ABC transporter permease n=1 Tax=Maritimibacter sp. 55A14 TaxID=2174844 RepID=UPI000D617B2C|nr:AzlC family ABC transporter permease [Maritimibacter sp. 55A14]PWE32455.1 branched-chain amino acid transporter AzlC [Maritimibacter sp. 55A14]
MSSTQSAYWRGFRDGAPFVLVVVPFGLLFGVVGTEAGLNLAEVMGMTVLVIAGAAQFAAIALMQENAPTIIVLATALAVNMRMAMYSASLAPYIGGAPLWQRAIAAYFMVDQSYAVSIVEYERRPEMSLRERMAYYFGAISPVCFPWYVATWAGAVLGARIPPEFALDFAVPITFLAITAPMMRTLAHVSAAAVSVGVSLALAFLPYNLWLMIAAVLAMMVGARVELLTARRRGLA